MTYFSSKSGWLYEAFFRYARQQVMSKRKTVHVVQSNYKNASPYTVHEQPLKTSKIVQNTPLKHTKIIFR